jgi:transposase
VTEQFLPVLVHDGIGVQLAARRLNSGKFGWHKEDSCTLRLGRPQSDVLVLGLR